MRRLLPLALAPLVLVSLRAAALTFIEVEVTCPIDGQRFQSKEMGSGYRVCTRLDLKQVGAIASPPPIHECPTSKFAFIEGEFTEEQVRSFKPWVESGEYTEALAGESPYYRLARAYDRIGISKSWVAMRLLEASWEVEGKPELHRRYLSESADAMEQHLREIGLVGRPPTSSAEESHLLLLVELRRRLGRFGPAGELLALLGEPDFIVENRRAVAAFQSQLVAAEDASVHYVPGENEKSCQRYDGRR